MSDAIILPSELISTPLPLIALTGLDVGKNPVHKTIWDAFSSNRKNDRAQVQFKLISSNYEFPVSKPKRQSYDWYHPKGILKKNWMLKHLHVLPSVVVLFQDIEWNDPLWSEKQLQCASLIQSLKNSLQGQNTKLAIALLQKNSTTPGGDDVQAVERTANLASACDISPKQIFVHLHNEHLIGYTCQLETHFLLLAQSYYMQMAKQIRSHRDQLTDSHMSLRIRHQFKLGMIAEIRMDYSTATTYYIQAYNYLKEIRIIDTNCLEIKTIAGFLNYKICKLKFRSKLQDTIDQFNMHIERFRLRTGFKEIIFEHYAWLSLQYSSFAELFCDAIKFNYPAHQTQHPGIYYHKASKFMSLRKNSYQECLTAAAQSVSTIVAAAATAEKPNTIIAPYANMFYSEFFGVRTSKIGDPTTEQQLIAVVQTNEKNFNHSALIISLLGHAMAQFKLYKCLRFRKKLAVDMAEEYLNSGDHSKALTLYSLMLSDYRTEKWYTIFTKVLLKTLYSSYLSGSVRDFISCSIEAMSPKNFISHAERTTIYDNLWKVLQNTPPISTQSMSPVDLKTKWEIALNELTSPFYINLDSLIDLFDTLITFEKAEIKHDETVKLTLFIRSKSEIPQTLTNFQVILADSTLNFKLKVDKFIEIAYIYDDNHFKIGANDREIDKTIIDRDGGLILQPNISYKLLFSTGQYKFTENEELNIARLEMTVSPNIKHQIILTQSASLNVRKRFKTYNSHLDNMGKIEIIDTCYISPTFHLTTENNLNNNQPMLINEYFKIETMVSNCFDIALQNVCVSITVPAIIKNKVFLTSDLTKTSQRLHSTIQIDIGDLKKQSNTMIQYFVIGLIEGNIELIQKVWYQIDGNNKSNNLPQSHVIVESAASAQQNLHSPINNNNNNNFSLTSSKSSNELQITKNSKLNLRQKNIHNMNIQYIPDNGGSVCKFKEETVIIPCVEEFHLQGKFFTLNRQTLSRAYRDEEFLLHIDLEIRAGCGIDILDMFLICDHNITEKPYIKQRKKFTASYAKGKKIRDLKILHAHNTTANWMSQTDFQDIKSQKSIGEIFSDQKNNIIRRSIDNLRLNNESTVVTTSGGGVKGGDKSKSSNVLAKISINPIGMGNNTTNILASRSVVDPEVNTINKALKTLNLSSSESLTNNFHESQSTDDLTQHVSTNSQPIIKQVYNKAIDSFVLSDHCRGFLKTNAISDGAISTSPLTSWPIFGVYCVRWRRTNSTEENESKFIIQGIEVIEPPLNIYCYLEDKMYVKVPMTLKIIIKNPSRRIIQLKTRLKTSENFMFSGNTQLNISIFSDSMCELSFNLYPLKTGWHDLPEFEVKYNTQYENDRRSQQQQLKTSVNTQQVFDNEEDIETKAANVELQNLVNRWMPKKVFILPMLRHACK